MKKKGPQTYFVLGTSRAKLIQTKGMTQHICYSQVTYFYKTYLYYLSKGIVTLIHRMTLSTLTTTKLCISRAKKNKKLEAT